VSKAGIELGRLRLAMDRFGDRRLLVVGDLMVDQFVWGDVSRISPEAPVPVVEVLRETMMLGGAANVANNLRSLGAEVVLGGIVGVDAMGETLRELAESRGVDTRAVTADGRPTTVKTRVVAQSQQVVRVDRESRKPLGSKARRALIKALETMASEVDAIIVSDYAKGVVTAPIMDALRRLSAAQHIPLLVDPKPVHQDLYHDVTLLTPNEREAEAMAGLLITDEPSLRKVAREIQGRFGTEAVLVTRGRHGMALWQPMHGLFSVPAMGREVFDVTGAGDTVVATLALGRASGLSWPEAGYLANAAAGVVVGMMGTATVAVEDLVRALGVL
jgi:rfaE bifunctional protein kinase chain/domain